MADVGAEPAVHVLLTGATGFLGKVVLEALLRLPEGARPARVTLLVRAKRGQAPLARLRREVFASACFAAAPAGWTASINAVAGELSQPNCGLEPAVQEALCQSVTHVVHCAASVDFDRPLAEAAEANVTATLNVLSLCRSMPRLRRLVSTSTAYVTPWREGQIPEALAPLPRPVETLWEEVQAGGDEASLLAETGHPNTYTYTKCLAEHLLVARREDVPLTIVRPSIISASWRHPVPGWIDSKAAFAGFVVTIGAGLLQVIDADPNAALDLVPVDVVAERLVDAAFGPGAGPQAPEVEVVHAVAGGRHLAHIGQTSAAIVRHFRRHGGARTPHLAYVGRRNGRYAAEALVRHRLLLNLASLGAQLRRDARVARQLTRARQTLRTINEVFPYFTHHTFRFATRAGLPADFTVPAYVEAVCRGAAEHLLRRDPQQARLPLQKPVGLRRGVAETATAWATGAVRGGRRSGRLERAVAEVRFDEASFEAAAAKVVPGASVLWVPSRQDALAAALCRQLCRARPDLGLAPPRAWDPNRTAPARHPFSAAWRAACTLARRTWGGQKAPDVGPEVGAPGAWVWRRSAGPAPQDVVWPLMAADLSALSGAPRPVVLLPVAISDVDAGAGTPTRGRRAGARVHLRAGTPMLVGPGTSQPLTLPADAAAVAGTLTLALERALVAAPDHLDAFAAQHPRLGLDAKRLGHKIEARGGRVLRGAKPRPRALADLDAATAWRAQRHWQRHFAAEVLARWPHALVLRQYFSPRLADGEAANANAAASNDAPAGLLRALAAPVLAGAAAVARAVAAAPPATRWDLAALGGAAAGVPIDVVAAAAESLCACGALRSIGQAYVRNADVDAAVATYLAANGLEPAETFGTAFRHQGGHAGRILRASMQTLGQNLPSPSAQ